VAQLIFFSAFLTRACLSSGLFYRCNLPFCDGQEDVCQKEIRDVSNFRAHIRKKHMGKLDPVPEWLERAIECRLSELKTKSNRQRRPFVKRNPSDFIHETFDTSGTSDSSSSPQTEAGGFFCGSPPPRVEFSTATSFDIAVGSLATPSEIQGVFRFHSFF